MHPNGVLCVRRTRGVHNVYRGLSSPSGARTGQRSPATAQPQPRHGTALPAQPSQRARRWQPAPAPRDTGGTQGGRLSAVNTRVAALLSCSWPLALPQEL